MERTKHKENDQRQGERRRLLVEKLTARAGTGGQWAMIDMISNARRNITNYLEKHNLPRPAMLWENWPSQARMIGKYPSEDRHAKARF